MKKVLIATAIVFVAASPALARSPQEEAAHEVSAYPLSASCRFITGRIVLPNGNVVFAVFQTLEACN